MVIETVESFKLEIE